MLAAVLSLNGWKPMPMSTLFIENIREKLGYPLVDSFLLHKTLMIMKKTLVEFGKSPAVQLPEEQWLAIKGGHRRRYRDDDNNDDDGDPGCPPDYDD